MPVSVMRLAVRGMAASLNNRPDLVCGSRSLAITY